MGYFSKQADKFPLPSNPAYYVEFRPILTMDDQNEIRVGAEALRTEQDNLSEGISWTYASAVVAISDWHLHDEGEEAVPFSLENFRKLAARDQAAVVAEVGRRLNGMGDEEKKD